MILKCKICGGNLEVEENNKTIICEYCGNEQTLPKIENEKKAQVYERANHFRENKEYDKATAIYETILNEDSTDSEIYWQLVLCEYGVEYVKDKKTNKYLPTCNRTQKVSVFTNANYKNAIKYADKEQQKLYEQEAKNIDNIQKRAIEIASKEDAFDIFISYKETDEDGKRTKDSVLAQDLYNILTKQGYKVFFSKITLENKLGTEYEPYIFAALNSAKVMIVLGTTKENFNSPWVKNEWSRFLALIKDGENKVLIPAYRDMNPYDLPEEFAYLQALDLSKIGTISDIQEKIKKTINNKSKKVNTKKRNKVIIIISILICLAIVMAIGITVSMKFIVPENKYKKAQQLFDSQKYDEAIKIYEELKDYKESQDKILDCNIAIKNIKNKELKKYLGVYDKLEEQSTSDGYSEPFGFVLEVLNIKVSEIDFTLEQYNRRVVTISGRAMKKEENLYEFAFQDSWKNTGKGTLQLLEDGIKINLYDIVMDDHSMAVIPEGDYEFKFSDMVDIDNNTY